MKFNNKKLEKTSVLINYAIAILLGGFLVLLTDLLIDDIDEWKERPPIAQFLDANYLQKQNAAIDKVNAEITSQKEKKSSVEQTISVARKNHFNAKESFDNWLKARNTVGSPKEDQEVLKRAKELDAYYETLQEWEIELSAKNASIDKLEKKKDKVNTLILKEKHRANDLRLEAIHDYEVKIFLIRLAIILPLMLLGIFFILKFRKHKYWPLFLGFVFYSIYAFFFGLMPYLPWYGWYIRYGVGIVLILLLGGYVINKIKSFIELKKRELKTSTTERAKKVQSETAEKALNDHMCPSCGKDFIVKDWDKTAGRKSESKTPWKVTDFCRFCGLQLFKKCKSCKADNFAHLPFCCNCGDNLASDKETPNPPIDITTF